MGQYKCPKYAKINVTTKTIMLFEIISDNVDFMFTDAHEIGTSDISICVNRIIKEYAPFTEDYASTPTRQVIRRCVLNCLHVLEDLHYIQTKEDRDYVMQPIES